MAGCMKRYHKAIEMAILHIVVFLVLFVAYPLLKMHSKNFYGIVVLINGIVFYRKRYHWKERLFGNILLLLLISLVNPKDIIYKVQVNNDNVLTAVVNASLFVFCYYMIQTVLIWILETIKIAVKK